MKDTLQENFRDYSNLVGIPYSELDCYGLAKKFYKEVLGEDLKSYYDSTPKELSERKDLVYTAKSDFVQVELPEFGDIVLIKIDGVESHIAIFVGEGKILHSLKTAGYSVIERASRWATRITGFYRLRVKDDKN